MLDLQRDALKRAKCRQVYEEQAIGKNIARPQLEACLMSLREGDTLIVWRLGRLGRNLADLVGPISELEQRKINFESTTEKIETISPAGRLVFHVFAALAEFERASVNCVACYHSDESRVAPLMFGSAGSNRSCCQSICAVGLLRHMHSRLQIAVLGSGKIGSTFAFQLATAGGHNVTAVARPGSLRLQQLRRDGGIVNHKGEYARVQVVDVLDEQTSYDLVIVTLLAHQVSAVLPVLQRCNAKFIHFMFNTFEPERLRDLIGANRCCFGMPFVQATISEDGRLNATIGASGQKSKMNRQESVDLFNSAGLPAVLETDMLLWLRCHVPLCVAFESICVAGVRRGGGASWGESMVVARGMQESLTLVQKLGYRLYPSGKVLLTKCPVRLAAFLLWSVSRIPSFRELLGTGADECRALIRVLVQAAHAATPTVGTVHIEAMEPPQ